MTYDDLKIKVSSNRAFSGHHRPGEGKGTVNTVPHVFLKNVTLPITPSI